MTSTRQLRARLLTSSEVAERLSKKWGEPISRILVSRWARHGCRGITLEHSWRGAHRRFTRAQVDRFVAALQEQSA